MATFRLSLSSSSSLIVGHTRLSIVGDPSGDQALPVASATSRPCEFSAVVSRFTFSAVPFPTFCTVCEVTCVIAGHFSFFSLSLTYLLTYQMQTWQQQFTGQQVCTCVYICIMCIQLDWQQKMVGGVIGIVWFQYVKCVGESLQHSSLSALCRPFLCRYDICGSTV